MEQELKDEIERLLSLRKTTKTDVRSLVTILKEHVDKRIAICAHCKAQIKFGMKQLSNWYTNVNQNTSVEYKIKRCEICNIELEDKRRKVCKECKSNGVSKA